MPIRGPFAWLAPSPPTQTGALWQWLQDTGAMLSVTLPTPLLWRAGREQAAFGDQVEGMTGANEVHIHASWLRHSLSCLCSQRLRTTREVTVPSLKGKVQLDQTTHSVLVCIWSSLRAASHRSGGLSGKAPETLTSTCPQPSSLRQFN